MLHGLTIALVAVATARVVAAGTVEECRVLVMGTEARIVAHAADGTSARAAARAAIDELDRCDAALSDYRATSEVRQLPAQWSTWTTLGPITASAMGAARRVASASHGAYDPTVGPIVALWREARETGRRPSSDALAQARRHVGWTLIEWRASVIPAARCADPMVTLDLGGVGKGLGAHRAAQAARDAGATAVLVAVSGDIRADGAPPGTSGWRVQVDDGLGGDAPMLVLRDLSVSTSGDTEQWAMVDGRRVGHLLDPHDGEPLTARRAATVVGPDGAVVDASATALCILGAGQATTLIESLGLRAVRVREETTPNDDEAADDPAPGATTTHGDWAALAGTDAHAS